MSDACTGVFDCDTHCYETRDACTRYLPEEYLDRAITTVKDADGKDVKWGFEGKVPNLLIRSGITPSVVKAGLEVTISGHPARDASQKFGEVVEVTFADGKTIKP